AKMDIQEKGADRRGIQEIIIKLCAEVRKQLDLQVSIAATWHDVKQTGEFQEEVLRILDEMEPGTRERVLFALKERGALRGAVTLPGPPLR
ncbi:MAG: hypothetical protein PHS17_18580, partial [Desulfobacterales bacterium]|nr:hypothetical protein [Desulfobacterales bacterium]